MALPRHPLAVSFLKATICGGAEAGEGYIEGTIFAAAAVITSVALLKLLSPFPVTKTVTPQTHNEAEEDRQEPSCVLQIHKTDYRTASKSEEELRLTCGFEERLEAAGDKAKRQ